MHSAEDLQKNLDKNPTNKVLKQAVKLVKAVKPEDRKKFNELWGALLKEVATLAE